MSLKNLQSWIILTVVLVVAPVAAVAMNADDELWIPAAARGLGTDGAFWVTDLVLMNPGDEDLTVELTWLVRGIDNSETEPVEVELAAGQTLVLADVVLSLFGEEEAGGAIHIEVAEEGDEDEGDEDDPVLVASARIYALGDDGETYGQGFEGLTSAAAIEADDEEPEDGATHAVGIIVGDSFRSNWYGLNLTEDDDEEPEAAEVRVELLDGDGEVIASDTYMMPPMAPILRPVAELGVADVEGAALRFTMVEGEGLFGASLVDRASGDPTTLESHWECDDDDGSDEFTDEFFIEDCTFATTGRNPYWFPLEPGWVFHYEGEDEGEEVALRITVLDETFEVDGVETRVVEEYETADGELVEISRNFFAFCVETGSVFYFGEEVDIYEEGEVVSHDGAWLAGEDGAEPGIIMPGTVLLGSRYFQEVAPGIALDRAEHVAMDLIVETDAGTFGGCLRVDETTPLEPGDISVKIYAPGLGLIVDDVLEIVEVVEP